jgi:TctA family transporter
MGRVTLSRPILIFAALIGLCALLVYLLKARSFELWLVVVLTLSMLATTVIVEPRYYIAPFVLGTLFARFPKQDQRRLLAWQIALSAAGCILIFWRVLW